MTGLLMTGAGRLAPYDTARADAFLADLAQRAQEAGCSGLSQFLVRRSPERDRLGAVLDLSTYLNRLMLSRPDWLEPLTLADGRQRLADILAVLAGPILPDASEKDEMSALRVAKAEFSLILALLDLFGVEDEAFVTRSLSELAEMSVRRALRFCLLDLDRRGQLRLPDRERPEHGCGLFVLGMGKLGGRELNYSSDIDLILLFEPEVTAVVDPSESVEMFSRLARRLVRMIGERTGDGYVFRMDLRLRPDPSAMPLAIPVPTALVYYESAGRDWERAAMIKARCIAGDGDEAAEFLSAITPFVYRRYLDFAAIRDIQNMKDRIDRHRGFSGIAIAGHNVKLGRGGIREIEFIAQTQQLVAAGRAPELRQRRTVDTLAKLAEGGWIPAATARELTTCYWFLRHVEHVLQMLADEQTHTIPDAPEDVERVARLAGFADANAFGTALEDCLATVDRHFATRFDGRGQARENPVTALLSDETDPQALEILAEQGYQRPQDVAHIVAGWGARRYRAMRSEAARERLEAALPTILSAFAGGRDPDSAIAMLDRFLAGLPAGVQFFALIASNPRLLDLLALIITSAPGLSETISRRPHVFDALIDPNFYGEMPARAVIDERLAAFLADSPGHEDRLDRLRIFTTEQKFLIGVRLLSGAIEGEEAGEAFADLAEVVIPALLRSVEDEFAVRHGHVAGGRIGLQGLGRLGSRELTASSDVDLILFYDHDPQAEESDGERPLPTSTYYTRLTQRLIAALSSPMAEGVLYEVDFRLRPSGNKGPLATHVDSFRRYQRGEAWTWERMALTRSRPIAGDNGLLSDVGAIICEAIAAHRGDESLAADVSSMRRRIERDKPARGPLDLKLLPGGLIDLEFMAQWAVLAGAVPADMVGASTADILATLEKARPDVADGRLSDAIRAFTRIVQLNRLGSGSARSVEDLPRGLADRMAQALGLSAVDEIEPTLAQAAVAVRTVFDRLLPDTAQD